MIPTTAENQPGSAVVFPIPAYKGKFWWHKKGQPKPIPNDHRIEKDLDKGELCELIADAGARVCRRLQFLLLFLVRCILHRALSGSQPCASASVWSPLPSFRFLFSRLLVGG